VELDEKSVVFATKFADATDFIFSSYDLRFCNASCPSVHQMRQ